MSFDLVIFDNEKDIDSEEKFMEWYEAFTRWDAGLDYDMVANLSNKQMISFFEELIQSYPPLDGPLSPSDELLDERPDLEDKLTSYSIGTDMIYSAFAWSEADEAYSLVKKLAHKHHVGFFNCSAPTIEIEKNLP